MKTVKISISSVIEGDICVAMIDAQIVHDAIHDAIKCGDRAEISFAGITRMTAAFLNVAVGQLYGEFSEAEIKKHMAPPVDYENWHMEQLKKVVNRAKVYFNNPDGHPSP